jgi:hypothetical protein
VTDFILEVKFVRISYIQCKALRIRIVFIVTEICKTNGTGFNAGVTVLAQLLHQ